MSFLCLFLASVVFIELFVQLNPRKEATRIFSCSLDALHMIRSDHDDEFKEKFMRQASLTILAATIMFTLKFLSVLAVLYGLFLGVTTMFPNLRAPIIEDLLSPIVLLLLTLAAISYGGTRNAISKRLRPD